MIVVAVEHHFPRLETGGKQRPGGAPPVCSRILGDGQLARTGEYPQRLTGGAAGETGKGGMSLLGGKEFFAVEQWQGGQICQILEAALAIGAGVTGAILTDMGKLMIELVQLLLFAHGGGTNFQTIVIVLHGASWRRETSSRVVCPRGKCLPLSMVRLRAAVRRHRHSGINWRLPITTQDEKS